MEGTHRDHTAPPRPGVRVVSQHSLSSGSSGLCLLPWKLCHAHHPLGHSLSLTPTCPPLTQLHVFPQTLWLSESRAQCYPSTPCEELQGAMRSCRDAMGSFRLPWSCILT